MTRNRLAIVVVSAMSISSIDLFASDSTGVQPFASVKAAASGRVTAADTGQPLRGALVRALTVNATPVAVVRTNRDGFYQFSDLPPGTYSFRASRSAFVPLAYGQRLDSDPEALIVLAGGKRVEKVDIVLPRAGAIAGTVTDEFGDPVVGARVRALRSRYVRGRRELAPAGFVPVTDDLGQFRVYGLTPGEYAVSASVRSAAEDVRESEPGYAVTFFPGTTVTAEIQWLHVDAGQSVTSLIIPLVPSRVFHVSGIALDRAGRPMGSGVVNVTDRIINAPVGSGLIGRDGAFRVSDLAPGDYLLSSDYFGSTTDAPQIARLAITVRASDITDIRLTPLDSGHIRGRLRLADNGGATAPPISALSFDLVRLSDDGLDAHRPVAIVSRQMTFEFKTFVGRVLPRPRGLPNNWAVSSVRAGERDVTDTGIDVTPSLLPIDVSVEITDRFPRIVGAVRDSGGKTVPSYSVLVFSKTPSRWNYPSRYVFHSTPRLNSGFEVGPLPPGEYYAVAVSRLGDDRWAEPDYLESLVQRSVTLSLNENEVREVNLLIAK